MEQPAAESVAPSTHYGRLRTVELAAAAERAGMIPLVVIYIKKQLGRRKSRGSCRRSGDRIPPWCWRGIGSGMVVESGRGETTDLPITMRLAEPPEPFDCLRSA